MAGRQHKKYTFSRRNFLQQMRWAPLLFVPAPLQVCQIRWRSLVNVAQPAAAFPFADFRFTPHYPAKSPLDDVLRLVAPGSDEFITEAYAAEIMKILREWGKSLKAAPPALDVLAKFLHTSLEATALTSANEKALRTDYGIEVFRRTFAGTLVPGRERFVREMQAYLAPISRIETAEFQIVGIEETAGSPLTVEADIRYDLVGTRADGAREQRIGSWRTRWSRDASMAWRVLR